MNLLSHVTKGLGIVDVLDKKYGPYIQEQMLNLAPGLSAFEKQAAKIDATTPQKYFETRAALADYMIAPVAIPVDKGPEGEPPSPGLISRFAKAVFNH